MKTAGKDRVLFLTLNTFSLTGGIEKVCRTMAKALVDIHPEDAEINVFSLHDAAEDLDQRYLNKKQFRGFSGRISEFIGQSTIKGVRAQKIILSHVHLLPAAMLIKTISPKTRIVLLAHGIEVWRDLKTWEKKFLRSSCEIWAVSRYTLTKMQEKHLVPAKNLRILNNCLDPFFKIPKINDRPDQLVYKHGILPSDPILFTLTRLSSSEHYKGYDLVLHALPEVLKSHPTLLYLLAGKADEAEQQRLEKLIVDLKLQNNVVLLGFIPEDMVTAYYQLADVFIMPSQEEGFGMVFIEAAACGTKVIAGNKDGSRDALLEGKVGTLIDPEDNEEVRNAILESLSCTKHFDRMAIQRMCINKFSYRQYRTQVAELLRQRKHPQTATIKDPYAIIPVR